MLIFTGNKREAQTDSIVQFILSGEADETDVRTLGDDERKILRKDSVDTFILAVPRCLGSMQFLRIWHDNSGRGPNSSWFLSFIVFRDIQTGEKFTFVANQWLAVERGDGEIHQLLPVAGKAKMTNFHHLFEVKSSRNLADGHLWFSIFLRPHRSRFTRCQRVGSCFALLFLSMLVNAMWYGVLPDTPGSGGFQLGPFNLTPEQISVGVMSNLIVFIPSMVIVVLFRKSRPRYLRKSRVEKAIERTRKAAENQIILRNNGSKESEPNPSQQQTKPMQRKKKFTLPWWMLIVAWIIVWICIASSCFFLLMYGIQFGNSKATKWIKSLVISFFSSILFIQPIKIIISALFVSIICKSMDLDEDDADEDEEEPELGHDEAWLHLDEEGVKNEKKLKYQKGDAVVLSKARARRQKDKLMASVVQEIFTYMIFLTLVFIISFDNRDINAFYMKKSLTDSFIHQGDLNGMDFTKVTNTEKLWYYLLNGFLTELRAEKLYNNNPPYELRGFFNDQCNRIMGYSTIKQIRVKYASCRVHPSFGDVIKACHGYSSIVDEDDQHYCLEWKKPTNASINNPSCKASEFRYTTGETLQSLPVWGPRDWYGAGGYVIRLNSSSDDIRRTFATLQENHWIDNKTRAVIIEFASYNAQVDLFGMSQILAEFTPGGGIKPSFRFDGVRLQTYITIFNFICHFGFILFVLYYTVREMGLMCKQGIHYFDSYWSYAEIAVLVASYMAIVIYVLRKFAVEKVLKVFKETFGNGYVCLQTAAILSEYYGYIIAFILFVSILKLNKVLGYNKRIGMLSATLTHCWEDLRGFLTAFFISFFSCTLMFFFLLTSKLNAFHNITISIETCFNMMLGKFKFAEMKDANFLTPIMFFVFVLVNSWILTNILITVIINSFQEVKYALINQKHQYSLVAYVMARVRAVLALRASTNEDMSVISAVPNEPDITDTVDEFPDKMDRFLEFVNLTYLEGKLNMNKMFKGSRKNHNQAWYGELPEQSQLRYQQQANLEEPLDSPWKTNSGVQRGRNSGSQGTRSRTAPIYQ